MSNQSTVTLYHLKQNSDLKMHKAIAKGNSIALQTIDISEEPLTPRQLFQISSHFEGGLKGLLNEESEEYKEQLEGHDYSDQELLEILVKKPQILKLPLIESKNETYVCKKPRDILKFSTVSPKINAYNHDEKLNRS